MYLSKSGLDISIEFAFERSRRGREIHVWVSCRRSALENGRRRIHVWVNLKRDAFEQGKRKIHVRMNFERRRRKIHIEMNLERRRRKIHVEVNLERRRKIHVRMNVSEGQCRRKIRYVVLKTSDCWMIGWLSGLFCQKTMRGGMIFSADSTNVMMIDNAEICATISIVI